MARKKTPGRRKPTARDLKDLETYEALKALMEERGFTVTVTRTLDGPGGDCLVRGSHRVILAHRLAPRERVEVLADALRRIDLDGVFLRPDLRELLRPEPLPGVPES